MTNLRTNGLTWVGARDTCVSEKEQSTMVKQRHLQGLLKLRNQQEFHISEPCYVRRIFETKPKYTLRQWICIIEAKLSGDTSLLLSPQTIPQNSLAALLICLLLPPPPFVLYSVRINRSFQCISGSARCTTNLIDWLKLARPGKDSWLVTADIPYNEISKETKILKIIVFVVFDAQSKMIIIWL